jgi:osmoprotectant transport system substrate-binding protein
MGKILSKLGWAFAVLMAPIAFASCGGTSNGTTAAGPSRPNANAIIIYRPKYRGDVITVGAMRSPEQRLFGEIFAQTYETAGFQVRRDFGLPSAQAAQDALKSGRITAFAQYPPETLTALFGYGGAQVPTGVSAAFYRAQDELRNEGLTNIGPTSLPAFSRSSGLAATGATAERLRLANISDIADRKRGLTVAGPAGCERDPHCLPAIERKYGLRFKAFRPVPPARRYAVLDKGQVDLAVVSTIDPQLAEAGKYTLLADDRHAFPATKLTLVARTGSADKWFPDFSKWPYEVIRGLTLKRIRELKAAVELEGKAPQDVASAYLRSAGFVE